jgi:hypothetical protein
VVAKPSVVVKETGQILQLLVALRRIAQHIPLLFVHLTGDLKAIAPEVAASGRAVLFPTLQAHPAKVEFTLHTKNK